MRIVHLSTHDAAGGAGRACFNLHAALRRLGHRSTIVAAEVSSGDPDVVAIPRPGRVARRLAERGLPRPARRPAGMIGYGFATDRSPLGAAAVRALPDADVVNLHWFGGSVDFGALLAAVGGRVPLVWSVHDMNAFTGGCHFDAGCGRFLTGCGACPQLASTDPGDLSRQVYERKAAALAALPDDRLHVVAPSRFFAGEAGRSPLLGRFARSAIRYAVDTGVFRPRDAVAARASLGIAGDAPVVGFVADSLVTRRKGFAHAVTAARRLAALPGAVLLTVGGNDPGTDAGIRRVHVDLVADDDRLAELYSAMDLLLVPSLQESMGFTALEALACERPVVTFDAGPLPEVVRPGETGALVALGDGAAMGDAAAALLADREALRALGRRGRALIAEECAPERHAGRYAEVYRSLLEARAA